MPFPPRYVCVWGVCWGLNSYVIYTCCVLLGCISTANCFWLNASVISGEKIKHIFSIFQFIINILVNFSTYLPHTMYFLHILYISKNVTILAYYLCSKITQQICSRSEVGTQDVSVCSQKDVAWFLGYGHPILLGTTAPYPPALRVKFYVGLDLLSSPSLNVLDCWRGRCKGWVLTGCL